VIEQPPQRAVALAQGAQPVCGLERRSDKHDGRSDDEAWCPVDEAHGDRERAAGEGWCARRGLTSVAILVVATRHRSRPPIRDRVEGRAALTRNLPQNLELHAEFLSKCELGVRWHVTSINARWLAATDRELVERARRPTDPGEREAALTEIYNRYEQAVIRSCVRYFGDMDSGRDMAGSRRGCGR
jgi:hypothetical protein